MKTIRFLFAVACFEVIPGLAFAQEKQHPDEIAFDMALTLYETNNHQAALTAFQTFLKKFPKSNLLARAHFNVALLHQNLHHDSLAIQSFKEILNEDYNEHEPNGLMEQYALFKHRSACHLAELYIRRKDYKQAADYIEIFDKKYPYQHFCGNEWAAYHIYKATLTARVLEGRGLSVKAIHELLPFIQGDGLASNDVLISLLQEILERNYSREQLKKEFTDASASMKVVGKNNNEHGEFLFLGLKAKFFKSYMDDSEKLYDYRKAFTENELVSKYLQ